MTEEIKCAGCGYELGNIVDAEEDKVAKKLPDGLAHNKKKILQVNLQEERGTNYAIFEYYTEYGMEGVVGYGLISPNGEKFGPVYLPIKALAAFIDFFRKELEEK